MRPTISYTPADVVQYEAALNTLKGRNVPVLLYLARAWHAFANRESNFSAMSKAQTYCQRVCFIVFVKL